MGITVEWYDKTRQIILETITQRWTWKEFDAAADQYLEMMRSVEHRVALVIDSRLAGSPPNSQVLGRYRRIIARSPQNFDMIVVVNGGGLMGLIGRIYAEIGLGNRTAVFTHSVDEALDIAARHLARPRDPGDE